MGKDLDALHRENSRHNQIDALCRDIFVKSLALKDAIAALQAATGEPFIKFAPHLSNTQLANCRVLRSRYHILEYMPRGAVCLEVGTQTGYFAEKILEITRPRELHLIDLSLDQITSERMKLFRQADWIHLHEGDSGVVMRDLPDDHFDFIYVDGDHSYEGVTRDLEIAKCKLKANGYLICNDYTVWSPAEVAPYGIFRAVHELCNVENWEFVFLALQGQGYHDVCLRRRVGDIVRD